MIDDSMIIGVSVIMEPTSNWVESASNSALNIGFSQLLVQSYCLVFQHMRKPYFNTAIVRRLKCKVAEC